MNVDSRPSYVWEQVCECGCIFIATVRSVRKEDTLSPCHILGQKILQYWKVSANRLFDQKYFYTLHHDHKYPVFIWCRSLSEQSVWYLYEASDGCSLAASVSCVWWKLNQHQRAYIDFFVVSFLLNFFLLSLNLMTIKLTMIYLFFNVVFLEYGKYF